MTPELWAAFLYVLLLLTLLISLFASIRVNTTFRRYSRVATASGRRAEEIAREMLNAAGASDVRIAHVRGRLTDHYDPRTKTLALSDGVYGSTSAAAIGVAAHEAGHAIQDAEGYAPLNLRRALVPVTNFASRASWIFIVIGMFLSYFYSNPVVLAVGVGLFAVTTFFSLVTLPVEFDASGRALRALSGTGYFSKHELHAARRVLSAAALTYVAALLTSIVQLLRLLALLNRRR